jgi:hypothetical protein
LVAMLPQIERKLDKYISDGTITWHDKKELLKMVEDILEKQKRKPPRKGKKTKITISKQVSFDLY